MSGTKIICGALRGCKFTLNFLIRIKSYILEEETTKVLLPEREVLEIRLAVEVLQ